MNIEIKNLEIGEAKCSTLWTIRELIEIELLERYGEKTFCHIAQSRSVVIPSRMTDKYKINEQLTSQYPLPEDTEQWRQGD